MVKIDDFELPDSIVRTMKTLIGEMSPEAILSFAKGHPGLFPGYRLIKKNVGPFRKLMLEVMIADNNTVPEPLLSLFSCTPLSQDLISKLPVESLDIFFDDFQELFGSDIFLTFLISDDREDVRQIVVDHFAEQDNEADDEEPTDSVECNPESEETVKELKNDLAAAKRDLSEALKRNKRLEEKIGRQKKDSAEREKQLQVQKTKIADEQQAHKDVQKELAELHGVVDERIRAGISQGMRERIKSWLAAPKAVQDQVDQATSTNLLNRVSDTLEHQARVDRHSGNLRILKKRLVELEQAKHKIQQARHDSLRGLPELAQLDQELAEEISLIQHTIGMSDDDNERLKSWFIRINEAATVDSLREIDHLVSEMADHGLLAAADVQRLKERIVRARDRHVDSWKYVEENDKSSATNHKTFIVDGHNVILGPESLYLFNEQNLELTELEKRNKLTSMTEQAFGHNKNISAQIFFDSPTFSVNNISHNVTEVYSGGGQEDQRADNAIIDFLKSQKVDSLSNTYVLITDDQELSSRAEKLGANVLSVFEYGVILRQEPVRPQP